MRSAIWRRQCALAVTYPLPICFAVISSPPGRCRTYRLQYPFRTEYRVEAHMEGGSCVLQRLASVLLRLSIYHGSVTASRFSASLAKSSKLYPYKKKNAPQRLCAPMVRMLLSEVVTQLDNGYRLNGCIYIKVCAVAVLSIYTDNLLMRDMPKDIESILMVR